MRPTQIEVAPFRDSARWMRAPRLHACKMTPHGIEGHASVHYKRLRRAFIQDRVDKQES